MRRLRLVRRARPVRRGLDRRDRDRRRQPRRRRRRPRPARARLLRPGRGPLQDLHHRRGAHGDPAGVQRPAEAGRGAAAAPEVHLRDHRAGEGHRDDQVADAPLPVPADAPFGDAGPDRGDPQLRGRALRPGGAAAGGAGGRRVRAGHAVHPRPAAGRLGRGRDQVRPRGLAARLHRRQPARRDRGRVRGGRRRGGVPRGQPGHRGRSRAAPVRHRHAGPVPRPDRARLGARRHRHRPARHAAGPGRGADRSGRAVRAGRADPGRRHRLDRSRPDARGHLAPAAARAHVRAGAAPGGRDRRALGPGPAGKAGGRRGRCRRPATVRRRCRKCSYRTDRGDSGSPAVSASGGTPPAGGGFAVLGAPPAQPASAAPSAPAASPPTAAQPPAAAATPADEAGSQPRPPASAPRQSPPAPPAPRRRRRLRLRGRRHRRDDRARCGDDRDAGSGVAATCSTR